MSTPASRLECEALEARDCPAASANLFNNILTVTGGSGNDDITVTQNGSSILAAGQSFNASSVYRIVITGQSGDDRITANVSKPTVIYGGMGNDTITGGRNVDKIYGGHGNDTIDGGPGSDVIYGGYGSNTINDTQGNNKIYRGQPYRSVGNSTIELQIIQLINAQRIANGLAPLAISGQLNAAAELHSLDMVMISNGYDPYTGMQHILTGTTRPNPTDRLDAVGYDGWNSSFAWGENIAFGYRTAAEVVNAWMNSASHRANILNPSFTETGVSVEVDNAGRLFFTQDFGYRA